MVAHRLGLACSSRRPSPGTLDRPWPASRLLLSPLPARAPPLSCLSAPAGPLLASVSHTSLVLLDVVLLSCLLLLQRLHQLALSRRYPHQPRHRCPHPMPQPCLRCLRLAPLRQLLPRPQILSPPLSPLLRLGPASWMLSPALP
jgi:hypothetical protein